MLTLSVVCRATGPSEHVQICLKLHMLTPTPTPKRHGEQVFCGAETSRYEALHCVAMRGDAMRGDVMQCSLPQPTATRASTPDPFDPAYTLARTLQSWLKYPVLAGAHASCTYTYSCTRAPVHIYAVCSRSCVSALGSGSDSSAKD